MGNITGWVVVGGDEVDDFFSWPRTEGKRNHLAKSRRPSSSPSTIISLDLKVSSLWTRRWMGGWEEWTSDAWTTKKEEARKVQASIIFLISIHQPSSPIQGF